MIKDTPLMTSAQVSISDAEAFSLNLADLFNGFQSAGHDLSAAQSRFHEAANLSTKAKRDLDGARADLIDPAREERPHGKNAEEREAWVQMQLEAEREAFYSAENTLAEARHDLEQARLTWDTLRYQLRCLEVLKRA